jgi:hypothetical protein
VSAAKLELEAIPASNRMTDRRPGSSLACLLAPALPVQAASQAYREATLSHRLPRSTSVVGVALTSLLRLARQGESDRITGGVQRRGPGQWGWGDADGTHERRSRWQPRSQAFCDAHHCGTIYKVIEYGRAT